MKKLKYYLPVLIWMIYIFYMSHQNGTISTNNSSSIVNNIINFFNLPNTYSAIFTTIIRKGAHICEYALLAILLFYAISHTTNHHIYLITLIISLVYASSDEFHQLFIPGRSGQIQDILIDGIGIIIGLFITYIFLMLKKKRNTT